MGSSWSANVARYGLGGTGATLAARLLDFAEVLVITNQQIDPTICVRWDVPQDFEPDRDYFSAGIPRLAPHFPYGYHVEPDVPV